MYSVGVYLFILLFREGVCYGVRRAEAYKIY